MAQRKRSRWRKWLMVLGGLALLLILAFLVVTSTAFIRSVVLPRVAAALNSRIEVGDLSLSPFSNLRLSGLRVTPNGQTQPLLQAEEVFVRYHLFSLIRGKLVFPEIRVVGPNVDLVQTPDGKMNLDALLGPKPEQPPPKSLEPVTLDLRALTLSRGQVRFTRLASDGSSQVSTVQGLELAVTNVKNGAAGKIQLAAEVAQEMSAGRSSTTASGRIQAKLGGTFELKLDAALAPATAKGNLDITVPSATGAFAELAGIAAHFACDVDNDAVRQCAMTFERGGKPLGKIQVSGPFKRDLPKGTLNIEISGIDRNVLNLFGAPFGADFAETRLDASGAVDISRQGATMGRVFALNGRLEATRLGMRLRGQVTPPIKVVLDYILVVRTDEKYGEVSKLSLDASQGGREFLHGSLTNLMQFSWGQASSSWKAAQFGLAVSDLNLADWRAVLGTNAPTGKLSALFTVTSNNDGKTLNGSLTTKVTDLSVLVGTNLIEDAQVDLRTDLLLRNYQSLSAENITLGVTGTSGPLLKGDGSVNFDLQTRDARLQMRAQTELPTLLKRVAVPNLQVQRGNLSLAGLYEQTSRQTNLTLTVSIGDFTGKYGAFDFQGFSGRIDSEVQLAGASLGLRRVNASFQRGLEAGGTLNVTGQVDLASQLSDLQLTLANLNQNALAPFLDPFLSPMSLDSASVNGTAGVHFNPQGRSTCEVTATLAKFRVSDPAHRLPGEPLDVGFQFAASSEGRRYEIGKAQLTLPSTPRANNAIGLEASLDLSTNQPAHGSLKLAAEALDLTPLYDMFMTNRPAAATPPPGASTRSPGWPSTEPAAVHLPVRQFNVEARLGRLYLRELAISNFLATVGLSNDVLLLQPFRLSLNGAPVSASSTVNLGVPGYDYALALDADKVPLSPWMSLANASTNSRIAGDVQCKVNLKGAGITGAALQKSLHGQFDAGSTNLSLAVAEVRNRLLKSVINVVVSLPDLLRNPAATVGNLLSNLTGSAKAQGGLVDEITRSPITTLQLRGSADRGQVHLLQALVQSPAFRAEATGTITLAAVLTNSTVNLPVGIALRHPIAEKIGLAGPASAAATNADYVSLPDFLTVKGTVSDPKTEINKVALAAVVARTGAGLLQNTGQPGLGKASDILGTVGNLLEGTPRRPGTTNVPASSTNAPARTNATTKPNPLQILDQLLPRK